MPIPASLSHVLKQLILITFLCYSILLCMKETDQIASCINSELTNSLLCLDLTEQFLIEAGDSQACDS